MPYTPRHARSVHFGRQIFAPSGTQPAPTASATPYITLPSSTIGLAVGVTILGLILFGGVLAFGIKTWRRRKQARRAETEKSKHLNAPTIKIEEPRKAVLASHLPDPDASWVPQIRTHYGVPVTDPKGYLKGSAASAKSTKGSKAQLTLNLQEDRSPPPAYVPSDGEPQWLSLPPPPSRRALAPSAPTPPASRSLKSNSLTVSDPNIPLASPARSESFALDLANPLSPRVTGKDATFSDGKAPRRMAVIATFSPTMHDELAVTLGEAVYLLEEFRDGWCLIQRGDELDAPRGVCPRFCLATQQASLLQAINRDLANVL